MGATSEHFSHAELACHHCHVNECKQELVDALEAVRGLLPPQPNGNARPLFVNDAYRCPVHNAETPNSAKNSVHMQGLAADVRADGLTARELEAIANKIPAIKGIGRADNQDYLHIDVRETPARWCYDAQGRTEAYFA